MSQAVGKVDHAEMSWTASVVQFAKSSVGSKVLMAVSGAVLWGYLVAHLIGNLLIYLGPEAVNAYAYGLHQNVALLWLVRVAMLTMTPLHIWSALRTAAWNRAAKPVQYAYQKREARRTWWSRYMLQTGVVIAAYLLFHLAHLTWRVTHPQHVVQFESGPYAGGYDVYRMLVMGFQTPWVSGFYILAQLMLAPHLSHGIYSLFQHLGLWGPRWTRFLKQLSVVTAWVMCLGFSSIPLSVLLGWVK